MTMTSKNENDDTDEINSRNWNKLEERAVKAGFREGIADGREKNMQRDFDRGYEEGFKNAFALGMYKGYTSIEKIVDDSLLNTTRGNCQFCTNKDLENKPISEIITFQTEETNKLLTTLHSKHNNDTVELPKTL